MCRWIAYAGPPVFLDSLIFDTSHSLIEQSRQAREGKTAINADGFGVGWYAERGEPGIFKDIQPAWNDENLKSVTHQISSPLFFAHVRASTGAPASRVNCHPFRWKKWMFMHNGKIGGFEAVRQELVTALSPEAFAHLKGATDSELMFMMLIDEGLERDPEGALNRTVGRICQAVGRGGIDDAFTLTVALSDGETIYAARFASHGIAPSLYFNAGIEVGTPAACRERDAVMIVSEPLDDDIDQWTAVEPANLIVVRPDGVTKSVFDPVCGR